MSQYNSDELWPGIIFLIGLFGFITGIITLIIAIKEDRDKKNKPRPMCEYCGYVALDERELHNHQLVCEKKKEHSINEKD